MIKFENITKKFKEKLILSNLSFSIPEGNLVAVIGGSGCGKTTILKMINRLITPSSGKIFIHGKDIAEVDIIELRRNIGYVIQEGGLFPHMTIRNNIELIPHLQQEEIKAVSKKTIELMNMVGLNPDVYLDRYPNELSGGQQQRIGIARAFATNPDIVLMDEPFSALDPITRVSLQEELLHLKKQIKKTIVFVTHDMEEAIKLADKVCILNQGSIVQYDTPENILKNPANDFVADFIGKNQIWNSPEYIKAEDLMNKQPITCAPTVSLFEAIKGMCSVNMHDSLMVVDTKTKKLLGVVKANVLHNVKNKKQLACDVMEKNFAHVMLKSTLIDVLQTVSKHQTTTVPVLNEHHKLCGIITQKNLVAALSQQYIEMGVK